MFTGAVGAVWCLSAINVYVVFLTTLGTTCSTVTSYFTVAESLAIVASKWIRYERLDTESEIRSRDEFGDGGQTEGQDDGAGGYQQTIPLSLHTSDLRDTLTAQRPQNLGIIAVVKFATTNDTSARVQGSMRGHSDRLVHPRRHSEGIFRLLFVNNLYEDATTSNLFGLLDFTNRTKKKFLDAKDGQLNWLPILSTDD
jgi:hypothetical protein